MYASTATLLNIKDFCHPMIDEFSNVILCHKDEVKQL